MAVTCFWYAKGFLALANKEVDWVADTIKCALTTEDYTPNQDTHDYFDDVTDEVVADGYTAGGATLASKTIANTLNTIKFDAADPAWAASSITARRAVIYADTGTASTSPVLFWIDFGIDMTSTAGVFTLSFSSSGIGTITPTDATGYP